MVVLTLHRDTPLSTEEIRRLPPGCYPVLGSGDTVARANLELPVAHVARYAAELARTIPDADFVAEERPTIRGSRLLEAGALDEPYWAYTPPLAFRVEPPDVAALSEGEGSADPDSPLATSEEPAEVPQTLPDTPETVDFASLVDIIKNHQNSRAIAKPPAPAPLPPPPEPPPSIDPRKLDLSALFSQPAPEPPSEPVSAPAPETAAEPPKAPPRAGVSAQIMDMFRSIRAQEDYEGVPVLKVEGQQPSAPAAPLPPLQTGVEHTVRRKMSLSDLINRMRAADVPGAEPPPEPAPEPPPQPEPEPPAPEPEPVSVPQVAVPGPESSVSAPEISMFWAKVQKGDVEGAEAAIRADGLAPADHGHVASLFSADEADLVALGLRVSRMSPWPSAARLSRRLLHHPEPAVRVEVARTLAALSGLEAEADLVVLSRDLDRTVSKAANTALRRLKKRSRF